MTNSSTLPATGKSESTRRRYDSPQSPRGLRNSYPSNETILDSLDLRAEYSGLGVRLVGEPNAENWITAHAYGREDRHPSAAVNLQTGRYKDFASSEQSLSFFEFAARAKGWSDWREARDHYASRIGLAQSGSKATKPVRQKTKTQPIYATHDEALTSMAARLNMQKVTWYAYPPIGGQPWGIARFDPHDKQDTRSKTFRPLTRGEDGRWRSLDPQSNRLPLFLSNHEQVTTSSTIFVVEGEGKANALINLKLGAVAPCHGAQSPQKSDWQPLAGKTVVIVPDLDKNGAGDKFAEAVAELTSRLDPPASIKILRLPGLEYITKLGREQPGDGVDIINWLEERDGLDAEDLSEKLRALAENTNEWSPVRMESIEDWPIPQIATMPTAPSIPFAVFPRPVEQFLNESLQATQTASDFLAAATLAAAGFACNNSFEIRLLNHWSERPNLWVALCGEPGTGKTPTNQYVLKPLTNIDETLRTQHANDLLAYEAAKEAKISPLPPYPRENCFIATNATVAALKQLLSETSKILLTPDELRLIVASFGEFSPSGTSSDRQTYLSLWSRQSDRTQRKSAGSTFCPNPFVTIVGGIQPSVLESLTEGDDGFLDRFLVVYPNPEQFGLREFRKGDLSYETAQNWDAIIRRLFFYEPSNNPTLVLDFDSDGLATYSKVYRECEERKRDSYGRIKGIWAKANAQIARLALTLNRLRFACGEDVHCPISQGDIEGATTIFECFASGAARVLAKSNSVNQEVPPEVEAILHWLKTSQPTPTIITIANIQRSISCLRKPETSHLLECALDWMVTRSIIKPGEHNRKAQKTWIVNPRLSACLEFLN